MKKIVHSILLMCFIASIVFASTLPKRELRAVWLSTVVNIDWPKSKYDSDSKKQNDLKAYLIKLKDSGCNAVLMQVRCSCDAMYKSDIEPWSYWFSGVQGQGPAVEWDPLTFAVEEAHKLGMELHAWVNPYRAVVNPSSTYNSNYISSEHITKQHPEWILKFSDVDILNPGLPQVRDYINNVLLDIVTRYDIDGLHMDDYFYPYSGIDNEDASTFASYSRGFGNIHDWRRDNINLLIKSVMDSINIAKPWVKWGVSPFGIYRPNVPQGISGMDAYNTLYCDPLAWLRDGSVDYLTPQCYWPFGGGQDYGLLIPWWAEQTANYGKHFYPGQAMYRASIFERGEIPRQIRLNRATDNCDGSVFFTANDFYDNHKNTIDSLKLDLYRYPALWPVMTWKDSVPPNPPQNIEYVVESNGDKTITWDMSLYSHPADSSYAYVVYRAPYPIADLSDMSLAKDIQLHQDRTYIDTDPGMYYYAITSLDRNKQESMAGSIDYPFVHPLFPQYADISVSKDPVYSWESYTGANQYTLEISHSNDFSSPLHQFTLTDITKELALEYQTRYYWRIEADNSEQWSPTWFFTTEFPPQVQTLAPLAYYEGTDLTLEFLWQTFEDAASYILEVSRNSGMSDLIVQETNISDTSWQISGLDYAKKYYWRIRSDKYDHWTDILSFKTRNEHIATQWQHSDITASTPSFLDTALEASGLAIGNYQGNAILLILQSSGDDVRINALDPETGADRVFDLNMTGISGGKHALRDIEFSEDGVIYASNCAGIGESFKVYQWTDPSQVPECVFQADDIAFRLGDHITVEGKHSDGSVTLYAPAAKSDKLIKLNWNIISGAFDAQQITLERGNNTNPCVAPVPGSDDLFVTSTEYYLRHFTADGSNIDWMKGNLKLPVNANAIASFHYNGKTYVAGYVTDTESVYIIDVSDGVRTALSAGSTYRLGTQDNPQAIGDVEVRDNGDGSFTLYVLGNRNGIGSYRFDAAAAMVNIAFMATDMHFSLDPNYPNPFNPVTTIPYTLNKNSEIEISIYDLIGRHIRTLYQGQQKAGRHHLRFDASGLSSGIYVCSLKSGKHTVNRKITLLK